MEVDWHDAPLVRIALAFIVGCGLAWIPLISIWIDSPDLVLIGLCSLIGVILLLVIFRRIWKFPWYSQLCGLLISFGFMLFGFIHTSYDRIWSNSDQSEIPNCPYYKAVVTSSAIQKAKTIAYRVEICTCGFLSGELHIPKQSVIAFVSKSAVIDAISIGDTLQFASNVQPLVHALNPGEFDYGEYLRKQGVTATCYIGENLEVVKGNGLSGIRSFFLSIQQQAIGVLKNAEIEGDVLGVASALILGERNLLESDVRHSFTSAGVVHILAVSGLHVGLLFFVIDWIFKRVFPGKRLRVFRICATIGFLWIYAGITGFSPSVLRAATMFSFVAIAKGGNKSSNIYNMLAASAFILLLINPMLLTEVGFQLSYLAVLGIVVMHKPIYQLFYFKWKLLDYAWSLTVVSLTAQLATLPLIIYYFGQFPTYFLLANLIVIPVATAILYLGIVILVFSWIPVFVDLLAMIFRYLIEFLIFIVQLTVKLPYAKITSLYLDEYMVALCYLLLVALIVLFAWPGYWNLRKAQFTFLLIIGIYSARTIQRTYREEPWLMASSKGALPILLDGNNAFIAFPDSSWYTDPRVWMSIDGFLRQNQVREVYHQFPGTYSQKGWVRTKNAIATESCIIMESMAERASIPNGLIPVVYLIRPTSYWKESTKSSSLLILDNKLSVRNREKWISEEIDHAEIWDMSVQGAISLNQLIERD